MKLSTKLKIKSEMGNFRWQNVNPCYILTCAVPEVKHNENIRMCL